MKNNILQIIYNSKHSNFILDVERYVRQFGTPNDSGHIRSIIIEDKDGSWRAYSPESETSERIKQITVLSLEYLLNLPVRFSFLSCGEDMKDVIKSYYDNRINANDDRETDNNLHLLVHLPINSPESISVLNFILNSIPHELIGHVRLHIIIYSSTTSLGKLYTPLASDKSKECLHNIVNTLCNSANNTVKGRVIYVSNYNEDGRCSNLSSNRALSQYIGRILLYLINDYRALSLNMSNASVLTSMGLYVREIDKSAIVNIKFQSILRKILATFVDQPNGNEKRVRDIFENFISSNQKSIRAEFESENISERNINAKIIKDISQIINDNELSLQDKVKIIKKFNRLWNQDIDSIEDGFSESTFEDIYMPLIYELALETPYPYVKELLSEIKRRQQIIKQQEERLNELKKHLSPLEQNCFWTTGGFKVGDDVYKLSSHDSLVEKSTLEITTYEPVGNNFDKSKDIRCRFSAIRNQGSQGSCVSFSLVSIIEYYLNVGLEKNDLSESFLYYTARDISNETETDDGVAIECALQSLRDNGVCLEELCPYDEKVYNKKPSDVAYADANTRRIEGAQKVDNNICDIKSALSEGFPVIGSFRVFKSLEKNVDGFVLMPTQKELDEEPKYHAMVICGYNDTNKYFIVRNSWGIRFGHNGYCYIPYSYVRDSSLTRGLFIVKMDKNIGNATIISENIDKPEEFSPRFSYEVNRNLVNEESYLINEERKALNEAIITLRNVIVQIMVNTEVDESLQDIDSNINSTQEQIANSEDYTTKQERIYNVINNSAYGVSSVGILWILYNLWSSNYISSLIIAIGVVIMFIIWGVIKCYNRKKNRLKLDSLNSRLEGLRSLRERKKKAYKQLQQLLLIISSVETKVKKYDDKLSNVYQSFKEWLDKLRLLLNDDGDTKCEEDIIMQETNDFTSSIFDGNSDTPLYDKFINYQLTLLRKIDNNFAKSVYDELVNVETRNSFLAEFVNIKVPVEIKNRFSLDRLVFLGDVSVLSPNNQELSNVTEIGRPNSIVNYCNPLIVMGLIEKGFSIDDIKDLSL